MSKEYRVGKALEFRDGNGDTPPQADVRILSYGVVDSYKTSWKPGVFTRSVTDSNFSMPSVWAHDPSRPIGVVTNIRDDGQHLDGTLEFLDFEAVPDSKMAYEAMKRGAYPGISFAFERRSDEDDPDNSGAILITEAEMVEVSPVLRASVPGSRTLAMRSDDQIPVSEAADLLAKFAAGTIDLSDALQMLKTTGSRTAEKVPDTVLEEVEFPEYNIDRDPVEDALDDFRVKKPYGDVKYADPKNGKYPVNSCERVRAAWSYINQEKNAAKYPLNGVTLGEVKSRIKTAAQKCGIEISD